MQHAKSGESLGIISHASSLNKMEINRIISREKVGLSFKEFYKENLSALKYEIKQNQSKLLYWMSKTGQRRLLEKKKYKCIGELSILNEIVNDVFAA